ncbi:MAG: hypothetical protein CMI02_15875 [Oceanospirillaceae bacterium]|nr:hypothetical protein [Oceanospirillaceae bacterium]MBT13500.1 hypothetical protein [Oceanospirillaceae bacterium]|tara:strand:+ start:78782 stop:79114 length:333 start_codon:yes stop_codon:yes gene_type:complete
MAALTIAQASELIWELNLTLEDAYWEASSMEEKDRVFNLMQLMIGEYMELLKISVQDHHYEYEVISTSQEVLMQVMKDLQHAQMTMPRRQRTSDRLAALLNRLTAHMTNA